MANVEPRTTVRPLVLAGVILGVGLGGFVDGIVLHQLLQWHHLLTAHNHGEFAPTTVHALEVNTLWDGMFHAAMWVATASGLAVLWWAVGASNFRWSTGAFAGSMLAGWGGFNLVEGVIDHHVLGLHHVRDDLGGPLAWDLGFLAFGAALVVIGWAMIRMASHESRVPAGRAIEQG